jgi:hypothetical protein
VVLILLSKHYSVCVCVCVCVCVRVRVQRDEQASLASEFDHFKDEKHQLVGYIKYRRFWAAGADSDERTNELPHGFGRFGMKSHIPTIHYNNDSRKVSG